MVKLHCKLTFEGSVGIIPPGLNDIKNRPKVTEKDAASIERSQKLMGGADKSGLVVYRDNELGQLSQSVFAVPDWLLFGT
jgi:hypothetical protein